MGQLVPVSKLSDQKKRGIGAGLSAVGAAAGTLGLAVGAKEVRRVGWKNTPKLTRALIPAEIAGLGGEVMATHFLHQDASAKPQQPGVAKAMTCRERGLAEVAKADRKLARVSKYVRRSVPQPPDELNLIAAAALLLDAEHKGSKLPWKRDRELRDQLKAAIARGYLNAPYTLGAR